MSDIDKKQKNTNSKKAEKGFSTALLLNISPFGDNFKEPLEGVENIRLNTSAYAAAPGENTSFMNDFLSFDLLQRIDAESPNPNPKNTNTNNQKIPDVNIEEAVNDVSNGMYSSGNEGGDGDSDNSDIIIKPESSGQEQGQNEKNQNKMTNHPTKNQILNQLDQQQKNFVQQQGGFNRNPVPLYSYYDSTSKYLSQSLLNEKSKQINYNTNGGSNNQMLNFNNLNNQLGMNFIHKNINNNEEFYQMGNKNLSTSNQFTYPYQSNQIRSNNNMNNFMNPQMNYQEEYYDNMPQNKYQSYMNNMMPPSMNLNNNGGLSNKMPMNQIGENQNKNQQPGKKKKDSGNTLSQSNSSGAQKNPPNKKEVKEDDYIIEMFGRIGWICDQCNNFNYDTRNKCNRCGIPKSPKKISKLKRKLENKKKEQMRQQQQQQKLKNQSEDEDKKKKLKERKGDWTCAKCGNLNFSFRIVCNRCQIHKTESEMMLQGNQNPNLNFQMNQMTKNPLYNYDMNQQLPMQFINNGQIYCNNLNVMNHNNNVINYQQYIPKGFNVENSNINNDGGECNDNVNENN